MSQSMYLYVYFRNKYDDKKFGEDLEEARNIFKEIWKKEGTGFDEKGNIKGLANLHGSFEWDEDAKDSEEGRLSIIRLQPPYNDENFSFNFYNYGADLNISEKTELRDIYKLFAEILSSCFAYVVKVADSYDEKKYSLFFDEDGKVYQLTESSRPDYIQAIWRKSKAEKELIESKAEVEESEKIIKKYSKEMKPNPAHVGIFGMLL